MNRRSFVEQLATLGLLVSAAAPGCASAAVRRRSWPLGVQLYTVRRELERDFEQTLDRIAGMGYAEVEFAGYFDRPARAVASSLRRAGLDAPSGHFPVESLDNWDETLDFAVEVGHWYVVIPWVPPERRADADGYRALARALNAAGTPGRRRGIRLAYHNQEYDFAPTEGVVPFDLLLAETDPDAVEFELDVYWMVKGGHDPLRYLRSNPGRFPMLHLKDSSGAPGHRMTEVGSGAIDWPAILTVGSETGTRHLFVEHDEPASALDSVEQSLGYLRSLRLPEPRPR
ncbi:MAG TPA: sugar phosphate isomerase/epimerase [Gemmatimonadaceae bacterium]